MKTISTLLLGAAFAGAAAAADVNDPMQAPVIPKDPTKLSAALPDGGIVSIDPTQEKRTVQFELTKAEQTWKVAMIKGLPPNYFVGTPYTPPYVAQNYDVALAKVCELLKDYKAPEPKPDVAKAEQERMEQMARSAKLTHQKHCP